MTKTLKKFDGFLTRLPSSQAAMIATNPRPRIVTTSGRPQLRIAAKGEGGSLRAWTAMAES
jgi:hypothetical protein